MLVDGHKLKGLKLFLLVADCVGISLSGRGYAVCLMRAGAFCDSAAARLMHSGINVASSRDSQASTR